MLCLTLLHLPPLRVNCVGGRWVELDCCNQCSNRIRGSMPPTNGSGSGSYYFRHWPSIRQQKNNNKKSFSVLFLFDGSFISVFKDKKSKRSHKTVRIKVFLTILLDDRSIRIHTSDYWIRTREAQKHADPVDPDPEHWLQLWFCLSDALTTRLGFIHARLDIIHTLLDIIHTC